MGFERLRGGRGRKTIGKEKEGREEGWNGERIQLRSREEGGEKEF